MPVKCGCQLIKILRMVLRRHVVLVAVVGMNLVVEGAAAINLGAQHELCLGPCYVPKEPRVFLQAVKLGNV